MNGLNSFDKTYGDYSLEPTDDLFIFWRAKVKREKMLEFLTVLGTVSLYHMCSN